MFYFLLKQKIHFLIKLNHKHQVKKQLNYSAVMNEEWEKRIFVEN